MSRRETLWWVPLAASAGVALLAGGPAPKRTTPAAARVRARTEGPGDHDVISYVVDANGTILVRTQADDVEWGIPKLQAKVLGQFQGMRSHWGPLVDEAGADYRVPSNVIDGIMWAESNGNPGLRSAAGAMGLLQVMPFHFSEAELPHAMEPRVNIRRGVQLLASARAGFRDLVQVASAYNAGGPTGPANGPWTNEAWLAANRNPALTSRWGYACEPGYIDRVVAASNTYILGQGQA